MSKSVTFLCDDDLLKWIDSQIKNHKFANRTHGIEYCIRYTMNNEKK